MQLYLFDVFIFTRGQFWPSGIVVACVCVYVCVSVCPCVNHEFVSAITHHPFNLFFFGGGGGVIDFDLQGQI